MILHVDDIEFRYNGHPVLEKVTMEVAKGDLVAVLGPNGVGKSTLLRCINGILKPSSGAVLVEDENILKLSAMAVARRIGYVAQRQAAGKLTAFDAILMGRRPHIRLRVQPRDLQIVDGAIKSLQLEHLAMRPIDRMSGGYGLKDRYIDEIRKVTSRQVRSVAEKYFNAENRTVGILIPETRGLEDKAEDSGK